eukprot:jgi/Chrzof1/8648/Cz03g18250.t1
MLLAEGKPALPRLVFKELTRQWHAMCPGEQRRYHPVYGDPMLLHADRDNEEIDDEHFQDAGDGSGYPDMPTAFEDEQDMQHYSYEGNCAELGEGHCTMDDEVDDAAFDVLMASMAQGATRRSRHQAAAGGSHATAATELPQQDDAAQHAPGLSMRPAQPAAAAAAAAAAAGGSHATAANELPQQDDAAQHAPGLSMRPAQPAAAAAAAGGSHATAAAELPQQDDAAQHAPGLSMRPAQPAAAAAGGSHATAANELPQQDDAAQHAAPATHKQPAADVHVHTRGKQARKRPAEDPLMELVNCLETAEPNRYALRKFSQQQYAKVAKLCNISCKKPAGLKPVQRLLYAAGRREVLIPGDGNCNFSALAVVKPGNKYSMSSMKDDLNSRQLEIRR